MKKTENTYLLKTQRTILKAIRGDRKFYKREAAIHLKEAAEHQKEIDRLTQEESYLVAQIEQAKESGIKAFDRDYYPVPGIRKPHKRRDV